MKQYRFLFLFLLTPLIAYLLRGYESIKELSFLGIIIYSVLACCVSFCANPPRPKSDRSFIKLILNLTISFVVLFILPTLGNHSIIQNLMILGESEIEAVEPLLILIFLVFLPIWLTSFWAAMIRRRISGFIISIILSLSFCYLSLRIYALLPYSMLFHCFLISFPQLVFIFWCYKKTSDTFKLPIRKATTGILIASIFFAFIGLHPLLFYNLYTDKFVCDRIKVSTQARFRPPGAFYITSLPSLFIYKERLLTIENYQKFKTLFSDKKGNYKPLDKENVVSAKLSQNKRFLLYGVSKSLDVSTNKIQYWIRDFNTSAETLCKIKPTPLKNCFILKFAPMLISNDGKCIVTEVDFNISVFDIRTSKTTLKIPLPEKFVNAYQDYKSLLLFKEIRVKKLWFSSDFSFIYAVNFQENILCIIDVKNKTTVTFGGKEEWKIIDYKLTKLGILLRVNDGGLYHISNNGTILDQHMIQDGILLNSTTSVKAYGYSTNNQNNLDTIMKNFVISPEGLIMTITYYKINITDGNIQQAKYDTKTGKSQTFGNKLQGEKIEVKLCEDSDKHIITIVETSGRLRDLNVYNADLKKLSELTIHYTSLDSIRFHSNFCVYIKPSIKWHLYSGGQLFKHTYGKDQKNDKRLY